MQTERGGRKSREGEGRKIEEQRMAKKGGE
jgi:hypothetical protein